MSRVPARLLLAVVAVGVLLAGCTTGAPTADDATTAVPETTAPTATESPATETTTEARTTTTTTYGGMGSDGYYRGYTFRASQTALADLAASVARAPDELEPEHRSAVRRGAADGSVVLHHTGSENGPLDGLRYVRVNGTYYAVNGTVVERRTRKAYWFELSGPVGSQTSEYDIDRAKREAVAVGNLSAPDRRVFLAGLPPAEDRPAPGEGSFSAGYPHFFPGDEAPENSTFADGGLHFVEYDDTYYALRFDRERRVDRYASRYDFTAVAQNRSAFADRVREEFVTNLSASNLTDSERALLLDVVRNGTIEWEGDMEDTPAAIEKREALVERLPPDSNVAYVAVNGTYYRITLMKVVE